MIKTIYSLTIEMAFAILMVYLVFLPSCAVSDSIMEQTKLVYNIPIVKMTGELINDTDSLFIFSNNNYVVFKFPYVYAIENDTMILLREVRYNLFGYRPGHKSGLFFFNEKKKYQVFPIDSILSAKVFGGFKFFDPLNDSLVAKIDLPDKNGGIMEKYVPKIKYDDSYPDTTCLFYSNKFKNCVFSFSPALDSQRNLKIFKVVMPSRKQRALKYDIILPEREYRFELKDAGSIQLEEITRFLDSIKFHPILNS